MSAADIELFLNLHLYQLLFSWRHGQMCFQEKQDWKVDWKEEFSSWNWLWTGLLWLRNSPCYPDGSSLFFPMFLITRLKPGFGSCNLVSVTSSLTSWDRGSPLDTVPAVTVTYRDRPRPIIIIQKPRPRVNSYRLSTLLDGGFPAFSITLLTTTWLCPPHLKTASAGYF